MRGAWAILGSDALTVALDRSVGGEVVVAIEEWAAGADTATLRGRHRLTEPSLDVVVTVAPDGTAEIMVVFGSSRVSYSWTATAGTWVGATIGLYALSDVPDTDAGLMVSEID